MLCRAALHIIFTSVRSGIGVGCSRGEHSIPNLERTGQLGRALLEILFFRSLAGTAEMNVTNVTFLCRCLKTGPATWSFPVTTSKEICISAFE